MSAHALRPLPEGHGPGPARPAVGRLDGQPRRRRRGPAVAPASRPDATLPDGTSRADRGHRGPRQRLRDPATLALGVDGDPPTRSSPTASTNGIPSAALAAYQRAETVINAADKPATCPGSWSPRSAGSSPTTAAPTATPSTTTASPRPASSASPSTAPTTPPAISDTDAGQYDYDAKLRPRGRPDAVHPVDLVGRRRGRRRRRQAQPAGHRRRRARHRGLPLLRQRRPVDRRRASAPRSSATTTARRTSTWCCRSWTPTSTATSPRCPTAPPRPATSSPTRTRPPAPRATATATARQRRRRHRQRRHRRRRQRRRPRRPARRRHPDRQPDRPRRRRRRRRPRPARASRCPAAASAAAVDGAGPIDDVLTAGRGARPVHRRRASSTTR